MVCDVQTTKGSLNWVISVTVTPLPSRVITLGICVSVYLLACDGLGSTGAVTAFTVFEQAFKEYGLPYAIRIDNGVPFSAPNALFGLSKLSIWWLRLGINIKRIKPGNPQKMDDMNACN